ncbi:hypothetical protein NQ317_004325 [Molorchus minor]|uniref:Uncharacterized protein n=1 Tax=Molorchus minor TaxID=1323400 RepID=A0ABQ9K052_9CUCU|nr:hypothetical protein NQ317_004325 [Molorchus minor]
MENGTFSWGEEPTLHDINIRVKKRSLTAIVGSVGSGKSSLLSAFLGEMDKISGRVNTVGSIAYVSQQAWIQNATLKDNILFGKKFDKLLYEKVIEACALKPDFDMLPGGDETEIGEKGINLSGGQKQRVSVARAVYSNADVYFLDDPLSAVDSHVGKHIFDKVIGPKGMLKDKTKVLVTHGITYLPQTENIVVIKDGRVSEQGTYQELLERKGAFAEFLLQHITEDIEAPEVLDELQDQLAGTALSEEVTRRISRQRSRLSESHSETGSERMQNGSLQRQKSTDSTDKSILRHRTSSVEDIKDDKKLGKLIEIEKSETGGVQWAVYKHYLKSIGIFLTFATVFLNFIFQAFSIGSNVWLGVWADDRDLIVNGTTDTAKQDMYLGVYGALGIGQVMCSVLANIIFAKATLDGAVIIHKLLLSNVIKLPSAFFDVTPVGRILGRFSNDINGVDLRLPMNIQGIINTSVGEASFIFVLVLCLVATNVLFTKATLDGAIKIHRYLLSNVMKLPSAFFDVTPVGRILGRFSNDINGVDLRLPMNFQVLISNTVAAVSSVLSELVPSLGCLAAAISLHDLLLYGVLRSPMVFFDTTPTGRIVARFSKDIEVLDNSLP